MPQTPAPLPLGEHRACVLEYLRTIALPQRSVAAAIIDERRPPLEQRLLLRPILVLWAATACGARKHDATPVAAAFDLFDRFMSLHDELVDAPAQGRPASPVARWGLGQSLNAGDALYALALRALAQDVVEPQRRLRVAGLVTRAVLEAIEGRTSDTQAGVAARSGGLLDRVRSLRRRSAALTAAALEAGAAIAAAPPEVCRQFRRAGGLLDLAAAAGDPVLGARIGGRAQAAVARSVADSGALAGFDEVVRYVVAAS